MILLSPFVDVTRMFYKDVYVSSFFPSTARPWNSLLMECFLLIYDLTKWLKSRICRHFICRFFLNRFHVCFNLFVFFFFEEAFNLAWTIEWISSKIKSLKEYDWMYDKVMECINHSFKKYALVLFNFISWFTKNGKRYCRSWGRGSPRQFQNSLSRFKMIFFTAFEKYTCSFQKATMLAEIIK